MRTRDDARLPWAGAIVVSLVGCLAAAACADRVRDDQIEQARLRADAAAQQLTTTLMARLTAALGEGGVVAAVGVCGQVAQDVARGLGEREGVILKRTGLRTRNPANTPEGWERAWLERAESVVRAGGAPQPMYEVARSGGGQMELRHLRPVLFPGGVCSRCHGLPEEIPDDVRAVLRERYPQDAATGFRAGDLRGAISVRVPLVQEGAVGVGR